MNRIERTVGVRGVMSGVSSFGVADFGNVSNFAAVVTGSLTKLTG